MRNTPSSPSVAMVSNYPKGTGYAWWLMELFWNEIATAAETHGWQSIIIYPQTSQYRDSECNTPDPSELESFISNGTIKDAYHIYQLVRHLNIRSLYLTDRPFRSWKYFLLKLAGIRSIVVHDHTPGDRPAIGGLKGFIKQRLNSFSCFTATLYVAISPLMRQRHLLNARIPDRRIAIVTNGIVIRDLIPNARERLLSEFGLVQDSFIICAVGRLNAYKRFDFAIRCVARLAHEDPQSHPVLLLIGDGPDRQHLEGLADSLGPECKVIFAGKIDDVWPVLCGADTFMHPSAGEGLSLAILEAMAAARPIVVPSLPSVTQTIKDGYSGLVYKDGSIEEAKIVLSRLSRDNSLRTMLGANARDMALKHYQLDRTIAEFHALVIPSLLNI